jgi:hypothetical protein
MATLYALPYNQIFYNNFIINYSKPWKTSIYDLNGDFYGNYKNIIEAKNLINKGQLINLSLYFK